MRRSFINELLVERGDITLVEIQARLTERCVPMSIRTVHRFFARHGIMLKNSLTQLSKTGPTY